MPSTVIVDTGFLVALFARDDSYHVSAKALLKGRLWEAKANLITIWPVITEAGFFLNPYYLPRCPRHYCPRETLR